jgi:hypothetical protein
MGTLQTRNRVFNGLTQAQDLLNTTGPCRATDGQRVF